MTAPQASILCDWFRSNAASIGFEAAPNHLLISPTFGPRLKLSAAVKANVNQYTNQAAFELGEMTMGILDMRFDLQTKRGRVNFGGGDPGLFRLHIDSDVLIGKGKARVQAKVDLAIAGIRWHAHEGCERIEIEFLSATGSPASRIGPVGVSILSDTGIVRVTMSEAIVDSAVADTTLNGDLLDRWFVVEGIGDGLAVDLHLGARAAARAFTTTSPARLIVDLIPAREDLPITRPAAEDGIVLMSPQAGVSLYPLQIAGYAAPSIDAVRIRLSDSTGVFIDRSVSTLSPVHVWHTFDIGLSDGPSGSLDLFVGTVDEEGEPVAGVEVPLDLP